MNEPIKAFWSTAKREISKLLSKLIGHLEQVGLLIRVVWIKKRLINKGFLLHISGDGSLIHKILPV